ncbi:IS66 family transposase zinc-finger binding domain-containing protein [Pseudomonas sp. PB3P13]
MPKSHCSGCGGTLRQLGEDVSEVLVYVPARFQVIRHVRPRLVCRCCRQNKNGTPVDV